MRLCFVVNSARTQKATYTTLAPGLRRLPARARRRVRLGRRVLARGGDRHRGRGGAPEARPPARRRGLRQGADRRRGPARRGAPRRLRRDLPAQQPQRRRRGRRPVQPGARLRAPAQAAGRAGGQRSRWAVARRVQDVPGGVSGRAAAEDPDHAVDRADARLPPRARRSGHHQAAGGVRRQERLLRGARAEREPAADDLDRAARRLRHRAGVPPGGGQGRQAGAAAGGRAARRRWRRGGLQADAPQGRHPEQHPRRRLAPAGPSSRTPSAGSAICCGRAWWPTGSTSWASIWSATRSSRSTSSRRAASPTSTSCTRSTSGTAIVRDLERKVELRAVYPEPIPPHVFMRA